LGETAFPAAFSAKCYDRRKERLHIQALKAEMSHLNPSLMQKPYNEGNS